MQTLIEADRIPRSDASEVQANLADRTASRIAADQQLLQAKQFPEGIPNQPSGPLYGIENTNRGCNFNAQYLAGQAIPQERNADSSGYSLGMGTNPEA